MMQEQIKEEEQKKKSFGKSKTNTSNQLTMQTASKHRAVSSYGSYALVKNDFEKNHSH
jgi:hypothetical protein